MATYDAFKATLGISLMEGAAFAPWVPGPDDEGLEGARGWTCDGDGIVWAAFVVDADGLDAEASAARVAMWRATMAARGLTEAVLLLVRTGEAPAVPGDAGGPYRVWHVDLAEGGLRWEPGEEGADGRFDGLLDVAVRGALEGPSMTVADLVEEEHARLAGRVPFALFMALQRSVAAYVLLGVLLAVFLGSTWLTLSVKRVAVLTWPPPVGAIWDALQHTSPAALLWLGATLRPLVEQGEGWRLLAANYLHAGVLHLFVNAYSLYALGPTLEKIFGTTRFLAIWTLAGGAGAACSVLFNPQGLSVGASGAIFGILGAMLVLGTRFRGAIPRHQTRTMRDVSLITLGINVILGATIPHIDNFAHVGGLLGGTAVAWVLGPHPALRPGHAPARWLPVLWGLPALALASIGCGVWAVWGDRFPSVVVTDAAGGYRLTLPGGVPFERQRPGLLLVSSTSEGRVRIDSLPQGPGGLNPPLTEGELRRQPVAAIARVCGPHERPVGPPLLARYGDRLFVSAEVSGQHGGRELLALTLGASRVLVVRTVGAGQDPWVRAMAQHVREQLVPTP